MAKKQKPKTIAVIGSQEHLAGKGLIKELLDHAKCANFMNQEAIDAALQAANERLMEQDRLHGVENPEPQYTLGTNRCMECDYGMGLETNPMMHYLKEVAGHPIQRVCYKALELER